MDSQPSLGASPACSPTTTIPTPKEPIQRGLPEYSPSEQLYRLSTPLCSLRCLPPLLCQADSFSCSVLKPKLCSADPGRETSPLRDASMLPRLPC